MKKTLIRRRQVNRKPEYPKELISLYEFRQIEAGNMPDFNVAIDDVYAGTNRGGFSWELTNEGDIFWEDVLVHRNFNDDAIAYLNTMYKEYILNTSEENLNDFISKLSNEIKKITNIK